MNAEFYVGEDGKVYIRNMDKIAKDLIGEVCVCENKEEE